ncbi:MAG: tetratricopeptide repeat protein [Pirellulaceae bacterium]
MDTYRLRSVPCHAALLGIVCALVVATPAGAVDLVATTGLFRSGQYAECAASAAEGIAESQFNENFRLLKIRAEMELGRYADALTTLDESLQKFPASIQLRCLGRDVCRLNAQTERADKLLAEIQELVLRSPSRYSDAVSRVTVGRFLLSQGVDPKEVLDRTFNVAKRQQPAYAEAHLASGELALAKNDYALAAKAFGQAIKLDAGDPDAHFGLARAFAPSDSDRATAALNAALKLNPNHIGSLLLLADEHIDAERYDEADQVLAQVSLVNPHHPLAAAYRAVLAHLRNQPENERRFRKAALRPWPTNPEIDHLIGRKLSQKYRFAEGEAYQRRALEIDATYLPARLQLAQDLLRLGKEEEGWRLADAVYAHDGYNVVAHNLVTLQESLAKFQTLEKDGLIVRMEAREAEIYGPRVLALLQRARQTLCPKYGVTLEGPVIVELFPRQQDFAIRTFGLPGGDGFLGVCFGTVITANSPASQGESPACWEATLWHEFCHVVTLSKTNNKMPRWLSEGISVYEERQAEKRWGQAIDPQYRQMMLGDELTPVSELSGAFLSPESPLHLQFAYFESSLVVEYLVERHGIETLQRVLVDLGAGMPINESLARYTGSLKSLDEEFAKYARQRASAMAPRADWSEPELPRRADAAAIAAWLEDHPTNYAALTRLAKQQMGDKDWPAAKATLETMRDLYPEDAGSDNPYSLLARVHRELGQPREEQAMLVQRCELSADDVEALARLADLAIEQEDWKLAGQTADRWLAVNPLRPGPHRTAAAAAEHLRDDATAVASYRALLRLDPIDPAGLHLQLATALQRAGDLPAAKRHALLALEETPRYRAAHRRLLEIVGKLQPAEEDKSTEKPPEPKAEEEKPEDQP